MAISAAFLSASVRSGNNQKRAQPRRLCSQMRESADGRSAESLSNDERKRQEMAQYREKAQQRLEHASERLEEDKAMAWMPDDLDELDNITMNRAPNQQDKVKMWGGWLDDDIAGRKAGGRRRKSSARSDTPGSDLLEDAEAANDAEEPDEDEVDAEELAAERFRSGKALFVRGAYPQSAAEFTQATMLVGVSSRVGGQYQMWLAQALDAAGEKKKAMMALLLLKAHRDRDVRTVSQELLYVMQAPRLKLGAENFVNIDTSLDFDDSRKRGKKKRPPARSSTAEAPSRVEKYSLDWYIGKKKEETPAGRIGSDQLAIVAACAIALVMLVLSRSSPPSM